MTSMRLGARRAIDGRADLGSFDLDADHLTTHGVIVGMTGSGKTGLVTVLIEEALGQDIPVLVVDVKGDLPNLCLTLPSLAPEALMPWVEAAAGDEDVTLVLRLVGRNAEAGKSREHALLAERRLRNGDDAPLEALVADIMDPPITTIGALELDQFMASASAGSWRRI